MAVACLNKSNIVKPMNQSTAKKLWCLFSTEQRYKALMLLLFMFIGMMLETLGVGMIIPILAIITNHSSVNNYQVLNDVLNFLGNPSQEKLVVFAMLAFIVIYVVKVIFLAFLNWWQANFIANLRASFSQQLFSDYLKRPYTFHLQHNSAQLMQNVITEVTLFVKSAQSFLIIISEALVFIGISILLILIEPKGALFVLLSLGGAGLLMHKATKGMILKWGQDRKFHESLRLQHLQQGLGGVKDIKLMGREEGFINQFKQHNDASARISGLWIAMQTLPRLWLELLMVISLAVLVLTIIGSSNNIEHVVPVLGAFAASAFRIMPSANRILSAFQNVKFALPSINKLYEEFSAVQNNTGPTVIDKGKKLQIVAHINLNDVSFSYDQGAKNILSNVNLTINKGEAVGFVGTTGAGKSTLINIILGLLDPVCGEVQVDGESIQENLRGWQDQIGYVPQSIYITDDSIRKNIAFGLPEEKIDDERVWNALKGAHLEEFVSDLSEGLNTALGERGVLLSGGQCQRIGIARALYHEPDLLVLDEATSALDVETEKGIMNTVKDLQGNKTILIIAHRLSTIESCNAVYRLENGMVSAQNIN